MKKELIILAATILLFISACSNSNSKNNKGQALIQFSETEFDFGTIKQGEKVSHRFEFKNTGDGDLLIKNVEPSCGCTVASFPNVPIKAGEESFIDATFNSEGYRGLNIKGIEVNTNANPSIVKLTISATVETGN
jgi:hypothetical protein